MNNPESVTIIDGTACLGKTSVLRRISLQYPKVVIGDFAEDVRLYPVFKDKNTDGAIDIAYTIFQLSKLQAGSIHDRGPLSALTYSLIFSIIEGRRSMQQTEDLIAQFPKEMWEIPKRMQTIIVLEDDPQSCLERMRLRNNGLDIMTMEYVRVQNEVFKLIASRINAKTLTRKKEEAMEAWIHRLQKEI
ncbi:putative DUTPase, partial [Gregarina niphandrodes]